MKHLLAVIAFFISLPVFSAVMIVFDFYYRIVHKRPLNREELEVVVKRITPYTVTISMLLYILLFLYIRHVIRH
jgi:hypothetical protein